MKLELPLSSLSLAESGSGLNTAASLIPQILSKFGGVLPQASTLSLVDKVIEFKRLTNELERWVAFARKQEQGKVKHCAVYIKSKNVNNLANEATLSLLDNFYIAPFLDISDIFHCHANLC